MIAMASSNDVVVRWVVNTAEWQPNEQEFSFCLSLIPSEDISQVIKFRQPIDQRRAFISRLLQRKCVSVTCGVKYQELQLSRTKGRKPFSLNRKPSHAPNFNFNVSHEVRGCVCTVTYAQRLPSDVEVLRLCQGDFTAIAAEPICICGTDVAAPYQLRRSASVPVATAIDAFRSQFDPSEWSVIQSCAGNERLMESCFQRFWSLKEAFIKARGDGLGFEPLSRAVFTFEGDIWSNVATVAVDKIPQPRWRFFLELLPGDHWVAVARGPPEAIVDADGVFKSTLGVPHIPTSDMQEYLRAPSPPFTHLAVRDLIPDDRLAEYDAIRTSQHGYA